MDKVTVPFTDDQVKSLNGYQFASAFHPFTHCSTDERGHARLIAFEDGWRCPMEFCGNDVQQDWAHAWMADWSWNDV